MRQPEHVSEEDLVLAAVGELDPVKAATVTAHLEGCGRCQDVLNEIRQTLDGYAWARSAELDSRIPPIEPSRAALKQRLAAIRTRTTSWLGRLAPQPRRVHWALALTLMLIVGALWSVGLTRAPTQRDRFGPDPRLTPGLAAAVSPSDLCAAIPRELSSPVDRTLALDVFRLYGIQDPQPRAYEIDYVIPPELGGESDVRNLWPQPYDVRPWNAHAKDALEDHLIRSVCEGRVDLETAQRDLAEGWVAAYQKHFRTREPLVEHASFLKDDPWQ